MKRPAVELKTKNEIRSMRRAGEIAGRALMEVGRHIAAGVTTRDLDRVAAEFLKREKAVATFVGYRGYPATICASVNDEIVHGIPGERKLKPGDIVSIDIAATVDGYVGDTAATWIVEPASKDAVKLVEATRQSLELAIAAVKVGGRLGDVGAAVQVFAEKQGYGVVREFIGHGIGRQMHEEPPVPNYGTPGTGLRIEPGLVIAIEPMITMGSWQTEVLKDGWTVVTKDGSLAAHFEHTVAATEDGPLVLTRVN